MAGDFTDGINFSNYLSSFWFQMFSDPEMVIGIGDAYARQLSQHYQDFAETVNSVSVRDIDPFHTELVYPIFIRQSEFSVGIRPLKFGDNAVFGPQPAGRTFKEGATLDFGRKAALAPVFYADLPDDLVDAGTTILNRLHNPSVILINGLDYVFQDGVIVFKEDIFNNDLIAKRTAATGDGSADSEIVLWATNVHIEKLQLYRSFGHLFFGKSVKGPALKAALKSIFALYSGGPSIARLDSFVAVACGFPVTAEASETVMSIERLGTAQIVITDKAAYSVTPSLTLRDSVIVGATLTAGSPLTTATEVIDRVSSPLWWNSIDGITVDKGLMLAGVPPLGFLNQEYPVTLDGTISVNGVSRQLCRFYLAGTESGIEAFWDKTKELGIASDEFLAEILWTGANLVDGNGDPDYNQDLYVNPMQILNDLIGDSLIIVKINEDVTSDVASMLRLLRQTIPSFCTIIVLININIEDSYSLVSDSETAVEISQLEFVDGRSLFINDTASFDAATQGFWENQDSETGELLTKTPEAISLGISPSILVDTVDLGGASVYAESVTARLEPTC